MAFDQHTTGDVGPPVQGVHIRFFYSNLSYIKSIIDDDILGWLTGKRAITE